MTRISLAAILLLVVLAAPAAANIVYEDTFRTVAVSITPPGAIGDAFSVSTRNLGPWTGTEQRGTFEADAAGMGSQTSNIDQLGLSMSGSLMAITTGDTKAEAESAIGTFLTLAAPTPYISRHTQDAGITWSFVRGTRYDGSQQLVFFLDERGTLQPGRYSVSAIFRSGIGPGAGSVTGNYAFYMLFVPEPSTAALMLAGSVFLAISKRGAR